MTWEEQERKRFTQIIIIIMTVLGIGIMIGFIGDELHHNEHLVKRILPNGTVIIKEEWRR